MAFFDFLKPLMVKAPELAYFDHLLGEYEAIKTALAAEPADAAEAVRKRAIIAKAEQAEGDRKGKIEDFRASREEGGISWNELYLFEMLLADLRPVGMLRGKVLSLRRDYRSVAGQAEYDEYLASKPKNLLDPPDPRDPPEEDADYERLLRDDLKDLLGRLFKRYALLPVREARLKRLTVYASLFCGLFLFLLLAFVVSMSFEDLRSGGGGASANSSNADANGASANNANSNANVVAAGSATTGAGRRGRSAPLPSIPLFVVLFSGAMGGFVSALQRIQRSPTEGDTVYNLAMLYHGSYAVFVAPLTGAIFSILLYMMFTGNILEGRFFPNIYTPAARTISGPAGETDETPAPTPAAVNSNVNSNTNANANAANANTRNRRASGRNTPVTNSTNANVNSNANANTDNTNVANANVGNPSGGNRNGAVRSETNEEAGVDRAAAVPTPTPASVPTASLSVRDFLYRSGPAGGEDYALLIIWSFIAGFAERFVPDSLNRLINK